tara:strand:- start:79 stop:360 length:282 start_codon:yes stop_codon:yes gene_type:complete
MANKDNSGALFKEEKKTEKHPDYKGNCMVGGKVMYIAAWINTSEGGKKYMSLSFTEPSTDANYKKADSSATEAPEFSKPVATPVTGSDNDLPF